MQLSFSFIIPVYNRPNEIEELLQSFTKLEGATEFEIVIVEDGSTDSSKHIVSNYNSQLNISYFFKENSGPGASRNFGMQKAKGNYFIILDSDCILPKEYLNEVEKNLKTKYVDCFGGPDAAGASFSNLQKAINFSMTSFITTGGIRGNKNSVDKFQPRSFNMGLSKKAFEATKGFGRIHPGEDPDLSIRLWRLDFETAFFESAYVYHKRRISWSKFYTQVNKFGMVRPILNKWHPSTKKVTYWFPTVFVLSVVFSVLLSFINVLLPLYLILGYYGFAFITALLQTKNIVVAFQSLIAVTIQFFGYGIGFLKSTFFIGALNRNPEQQFPKLFFKHK
ncbi:glycosyltransferase family 2 protein [Lacinutrix sp. Bg11-31]|uniref:glycosyltransferase n=1 Tax=Lacinutrix sp. Bg11-31 TaxID=2057808 RepID=UPI000C30842A|nr:glycosyltransferase [Lacinutrix sp. Bg11-31]AUC81910.1 glycosyl transferase family 2 [Lacinutrix sp. Bg11-31]